MADPDLPINWGGGHPDPEIRGWGVSKKFFWPFGPQFTLTIRGGRAPWALPLDPPLHSRVLQSRDPDLNFVPSGLLFLASHLPRILSIQNLAPILPQNDSNDCYVNKLYDDSARIHSDW